MKIFSGEFVSFTFSTHFNVSAGTNDDKNASKLTFIQSNVEADQWPHLGQSVRLGHLWLADRTEPSEAECQSSFPPDIEENNCQINTWYTISCKKATQEILHLTFPTNSRAL